MAIRTFIFCDVCNQRGIRYVEQRRGPQRDHVAGKRVTDNRSWFEGDIDTAIKLHGWVVWSPNKHVCPKCAVRQRNKPIP
jgi:hypothetical protein